MTQSTRFVKPTRDADGNLLSVPMPPPEVGRLPAEGATVPWSTYWRRRLRFGEIELGAGSAAAEPAPAKKTTRRKKTETEPAE